MNRTGNQIELLLLNSILRHTRVDNTDRPLATRQENGGRHPGSDSAAQAARLPRQPYRCLGENLDAGGRSGCLGSRGYLGSTVALPGRGAAWAAGWLPEQPAGT